MASTTQHDRQPGRARVRSRPGAKRGVTEGTTREEMKKSPYGRTPCPRYAARTARSAVRIVEFASRREGLRRLQGAGRCGPPCSRKITSCDLAGSVTARDTTGSRKAVLQCPASWSRISPAQPTTNVYYCLYKKTSPGETAAHGRWRLVALVVHF